MATTAQRQDPAVLLKVEHAVTRVLARAPGSARAYPRVLEAICVELGWEFGAAWEVTVDDAMRCVATWSASGLDGRLPEPVEAAAYYVVAEALTNVAKYARASAVQVSVERADGHVFVTVADDGIGGADGAAGSGLRGLADRVEALDGHLDVQSPAGSGTTVRARLPCRST